MHCNHVVYPWRYHKLWETDLSRFKTISGGTRSFMYSIIVELSTVHNGKSQGDTEWYLLPQHYYIYTSWHEPMCHCGQVHILLGTCIIIVSTSSLYFCLFFLSINQEMHVLVNQIHIKHMYIHIIHVITWNMKKGNVRN